jgi:pre-mRNA-processing factor 19
MLCSISGVVPEDAVVNSKTGYLYERSLIEKHIELTGQDPVTKETAELTDVLPVKSELGELE